MRSRNPRTLNLEGEDTDPLAGMANLFDIAMVFAVALILALIAAVRVPDLLTSDADLAIVKNPGAPDMELILKKGVKIERYKVTADSLSGAGRRLGKGSTRLWRSSTARAAAAPPI